MVEASITDTIRGFRSNIRELLFLQRVADSKEKVLLFFEIMNMTIATNFKAQMLSFHVIDLQV